MKKKALVYMTALLVVIGLCLFAPFGSKANAATKPSVKKKNVVLYENASPYTIELKNVSSSSKVKYTSSNKKVVKIKNSKVVPVDVGEAVVTVKVTQSGKTYKLKVNFAVVEAESKKSDYDALAKASIKKLDKIIVHTEGPYTTSGYTVFSTEKEVKNIIYYKSLSKSGFDILISDLNLLRSEKEFTDIFPWITELEYSKITAYNEKTDQSKYPRFYQVLVSVSDNRSLYPDECAIIYAIVNKDTSLLDSDARDLYDKVMKVAKELKADNDYDTVKNIHDYLLLNLAYPSSWTGDGVHTLNFAVNRGLCVCDGYSKYFYFLCWANGIECKLVSGNATNSTGSSESHAWNKVKIDKKWYSIDVTWDDPYPDEKGRILYNYFLLADSDMAINHTWNNNGLPKANFTDLGYLYERYKGITRFTGKNEAVKYVQKTLEKAYSDSFRCDMKFLDSTGDTTVEYIKSIIKTYYNQYKCSYSYSTEGAGVYGIYYEVSVYRQ